MSPKRTRRIQLWLATVLLAITWVPTAAVTAQQQDVRYFSQTGYRIGDDAFWDYFRRRGGVRTFGYPASNPFTLFGFKIQVFQREILQHQPDGSVAMMNILDDGLMPYTAINGSTFPAPDQELLRRQPQVGDPEYHARALRFVKENAPDDWQGMKVNFFKTFSDSVKAEDAFPDGKGDPSLVPGFNLEVWGLPTSKPTFDPANANFVYLRFQRGIMHFDTTTGQTQGLLLADYVKAIMTLRNLPPDLDSQARQNRLYAQFDPKAVKAIGRPKDLPGSDLSDAFRREASVVVDAGHGGKEVGASYKFLDGVTVVEKELNLNVASKLVQLLKESGIAAVPTRTTDSQVNATRDVTGDAKVGLTDDLQARVDMANDGRADLIVAVHFNGVADASKRGTQVFYSEGRPFSDRSRVLAELAQSSLIKSLKDAGYETLDRKATPDSGILGRGNHFFLLGPASEAVKRPSQMPGIIGEALFVTNADDANALRQDRVLNAVARGYADAIKAYFQKYPVI